MAFPPARLTIFLTLEIRQQPKFIIQEQSIVVKREETIYGSSIFSLCKGEEIAKKVAEAVIEVYKNTGIEYDVYVSKINSKGIKIINLK